MGGVFVIIATGDKSNKPAESMPSLFEHVRRHLADCCRRAGRRCPQFSDAQVLRALVLAGHDFGPITSALREAAGHDVSGEPRVPAGQAGGGEWTAGGGGGAASARARPKWVKRHARYKSVARRRRVIAALRSEAELAFAIDAHNLPDSEPADCVLAVGPGGELLTERQHVKDFLHARAEAVRLWRENPHGPYAEEYRRTAETPLSFVEVKTLLTTERGEVHISKKAMARKRAWEEKYNARFALVVADKRKGRKHSGHVWHYSPTLQQTTHLSQMAPSDFGAISDNLFRGQKL
jgi:hypothetical protein